MSNNTKKYKIQICVSVCLSLAYNSAVRHESIAILTSNLSVRQINVYPIFQMLPTNL